SSSPVATPMRARPKSKPSRVPRAGSAATVDTATGLGRVAVLPARVWAAGAASGMPGDLAEIGEIDAEILHGGHQAFFGRQLEDDRHVGGHGEPGVVEACMLGLPGGPAGVAERDRHAARFAAGADRLQHVAAAGEADLVADLERGVPFAERAVEHEAAIGLHRAA